LREGTKEDEEEEAGRKKSVAHLDKRERVTEVS
jgi:hypothetical protein